MPFIHGYVCVGHVDLSTGEGLTEGGYISSDFSSCPLSCLPGGSTQLSQKQAVSLSTWASRACVLSFVPTADLSCVWSWKMKPWQDGNWMNFPQKWNVSLPSTEPACQLKIYIRKTCGSCSHFIKVQHWVWFHVCVWL